MSLLVAVLFFLWVVVLVPVLLFVAVLCWC